MRANGKRMVKQLTERRLTSVSQQQRTSRSQNALLFGLEGSMHRSRWLGLRSGRQFE